MLAMGSILVGVGILGAGLLTLLFRNPRAPRWTRPELVAMLAVIPVTGTLGLGFGYMLVGAYQLLYGRGELFELAVLLGVAIVVVAFLRVVIGRRLRAYGAVGAPAVVAGDPSSELTVMAADPPRPQAPGRPAHLSPRKTT